MPLKSTILSLQADIFRVVQDPRRYNRRLKEISALAGIEYNSLCNYAAGKTEMPVSALHALCGIVPSELLSLLLPDTFQIVRVPDEIDLDEFDDMCRDFVQRKAAAHRADSPGGVAIVQSERDELMGSATALRAVA